MTTARDRVAGVCAVLAVCIAVSGFLGLVVLYESAYAGTPTVRALVATMKRNGGYIERRQWSLLWQSYTPRFRATCGRARWQWNIAGQRNRFSDSARFRFSRISVSLGRTRSGTPFALVSYTWTIGLARARVVDDVYVFAGGRWLDELDPMTTCGP